MSEILGDTLISPGGLGLVLCLAESGRLLLVWLLLVRYLLVFRSSWGWFEVSFQGGRVDTLGHFFIVSNHKVFTMLRFARVWGVFWHVKKVSFVEKRICVFIIHGPNRWDFAQTSTCAHSHTRTPRNTTLHHPSMHSDNDTDQKHYKLLHFRTHLDQPRNCLYLLSRISGCSLLNLCWSTRDCVVAACGRRATQRLWRATCRPASRRVPSPKTVGGRAAVFVNVLLQSNEEILLCGLFGGISLPKKTHGRFQHRLTARDSRREPFVILSSLSQFQQMCHLIPWLTLATNCTLTRHHPIHTQDFTIWSHSTTQVPCSCLGSTCSDVSSRPPCFEFFVMEGHISTFSQF